MPPDGSPWPLPDVAQPWRSFAEWSAWYAGDTAALAAVYGGARASGTRPSDRPSQSRGGAVGAVARWFWGQPTPGGQQSRKLHMPAASEVCTQSANLLFADPPAIRVQGDDRQAAQDRLDVLFGEDMDVRLHGAAEVGAALGGVYLRAGWDEEVADHPFTTAVHADAAAPTFRYGRLIEVTFMSEVERRDQRVLRHLEHHGRGYVEHALFLGSPDKLGRRVPLEEAQGTAHLASAVNADSVVETGVDRLLVDYVANGTGRRWRTVPGPARELGRSDLDGQEPALDALDRTWTSWMRDIELGKARLLVPQSYLSSNGPGQGATFDADQEVFTPVNALLDREGLHITPSQFAIRFEAHRATATALREAIVSGAGYSTQTFGLSTDVAMTATESNVKERATNGTRGQKQRRWGLALASQAETLMALDREHFRSGVEPVRPAVEWPPMVQDQPQALAQTASLLRGAEAASTRTLVRMVHPDWEDQAVDDEVAAILASAPTPPLEDAGGPVVDDPDEPDAGGPGGD